MVGPRRMTFLLVERIYFMYIRRQPEFSEDRWPIR